MRAQKKYSIYHVLFWLLLFGAWYFFRYDDYYSVSEALQVTVIKVLFLAALVYITNLILLPVFLYKKRYVAFGVLFILLVFFSSALKMHMEGIILYGQENFKVWYNFKQRVYDNIIPHFLLVSTGAAIQLLYDYGNTQRSLAAVTKERAEAELNFLRSQMNPHFLFNAINSVYFLIDKNNKDARDALHTFSEMLRYQLYECNVEKITVEKEIEFLTNYVTVQKMRIPKPASVKFDVNKNISSLLIEPLILLPFVENGFKHISHFDDRENYIIIVLNGNQNEMVLMVENSTANNTSNTPGLGLANVKRRLQLLYPNRHLLVEEKTELMHKVTLHLYFNGKP